MEQLSIQMFNRDFRIAFNRDKTRAFARRYIAPFLAIIFFLFWVTSEAGRMPGAFTAWTGAWPLVITTLAIACAGWQPRISLGLTAILLILQLVQVIPAMETNYWAIYLGSFFAVGLSLWNAPPEHKKLILWAGLGFTITMAYLMVTPGYGRGVGWFSVLPDAGPYQPSVSSLFWCIVLLGVVMAFCAVLGLLASTRETKRRMEREQAATVSALTETESELTIEQERGRISRDLHDVLAHSLAVIAAQADGARYTDSDQSPPVTEALANIASSARSALIDAQRVIEGVSGEQLIAPQPCLADISDLVTLMETSNIRCERTDSGSRQHLGAGQELAIYRIVQESFTNILKHGASDSWAVLDFDWNSPGLALRISSVLAAGTGIDPAVPQLGSGRGIAGMKERARLAGGWLTAEDDGDGIFRVNAFIPYPVAHQLPQLVKTEAEISHG